MKFLLTLAVFLFIFQSDTTKKDTLKFTRNKQKITIITDTTKIINYKLDSILKKIKIKKLNNE